MEFVFIIDRHKNISDKDKDTGMVYHPIEKGFYVIIANMCLIRIHLMQNTHTHTHTQKKNVSAHYVK